MKKPDKKATQSTKTFYPWHKRRGHHCNCSVSKTGFDRNGSQILDKRFPRFFQRRKKVTTKHNTVFENNSKSLILKHCKQIKLWTLSIFTPKINWCHSGWSGPTNDIIKSCQLSKVNISPRETYKEIPLW